MTVVARGLGRVHGYRMAVVGLPSKTQEAWISTFPSGSEQLMLRVRRAEGVTSVVPGMRVNTVSERTEVACEEQAERGLLFFFFLSPGISL